MNLITTTSIFLIVFGGGRVIDAASIGEFTNDTNTEIYSPLTPEEEILIEEFRNENSAILTDIYLRSKSYLAGALRVKKWDKVEALKQLKRVLQWRATNKIEALGVEQLDPESLEWFNLAIKGYTRDGCPITYVDFGDWRMDEFMLSKEFVRDGIHQLRKHFYQLYEKTRRSIRDVLDRNPKCDQAILLLDAKNFTMAHVAESNALNVCIHEAITLETYYQNMFSNMVFINCSEDFRYLIKNLQPYMSYTGRVMRYYTEEETEQAKKDVLSLADQKELRQRYFGTKVE